MIYPWLLFLCHASYITGTVLLLSIMASAISCGSKRRTLLQGFRIRVADFVFYLFQCMYICLAHDPFLLEVHLVSALVAQSSLAVRTGS